ncbi:MAG: hypothetical protein ACQKBV_01240, partial [Puniceicoccales bacterium]
MSAISSFSLIFTFIWVAFWLGLVILHIWLALYIAADAKAFRHRQPLFLDSPFLWMFLTLLTGLVGAAFYWLVHYST